MACSKITGYKRTAAGILGMLILFIILFSSILIASEVKHECTGEDCPICACIQQCENTLRHIRNTVDHPAAAIIPIIFMLVSADLFVIDSAQETLVSSKIRLNN